MTSVAPQTRQTEPVELIAAFREETWPVRVERFGAGYRVMGRASCFIVYVQQTPNGWLVSVPGERRCGEVLVDPSGVDIRDYCDIKNPVDASTIAAAVRFIIQELISHG